MNGSTAITARGERAGRSSREAAPFRGWAAFVREALANPRNVGALLPSSKTLARHLARHTRPEAGGLTVDLGAGTGVVTAALLDRGVPPGQLVAVERAPALSEILRTRFPGIRVVCGDAAELRRLLRRQLREAPDGPVQIVSSLPLRTLPEPVVRSILREIAALLGTEGVWVQYTYALAHRRVPPGFRRRESSFVWKNVPPARIDVFTVDKTG